MGVFRFKNLSKFKNVKQGISTREFGSMKNSDGLIDKKKLEFFLKTMDLPKDAICMHQVHGNGIQLIEDKKDLIVKNTDGLITNKNNIPLCILTADCLPIIFFDPKKRAIGIAHGGRKGLRKRILKEIIKEMIKEFGSNPADLIVGIGPGIEKKCYEVEGHYLDLSKIAIDQMVENGVKQEKIEDLKICTKCNIDKFYSYRGGDGNDRFASIISLV